MINYVHLIGIILLSMFVGALVLLCICLIFAIQEKRKEKNAIEASFCSTNDMEE